MSPRQPERPERRVDLALQPFVEEEGSSGDSYPVWIITFADMMSLLFAFFLLLLTFANMDIAKFRKMLGSIHGAFGAEETAATAPAAGAQQPIMVSSEDLEGRYTQMAENLASVVAEEGLSGSVEISADASGVVVRVVDDLMYAAGSAELKPEAEGKFARLAARLAALESLEIVVEGHTDSTTIATDRFPSNWELSSARATGAVRYLLARGVASERMVAVGYGPTRPIAANDTEEHRARNRRIELRLCYPAAPRPAAAAASPAKDAGEAVP